MYYSTTSANHRIGARAFLGCNSLQKIALPDQVSQIGPGAFSKCDSLRQANIPEALEDLPQGLFQM